MSKRGKIVEKRIKVIGCIMAIIISVGLFVILFESLKNNIMSFFAVLILSCLVGLVIAFLSFYIAKNKKKLIDCKEADKQMLQYLSSVYEEMCTNDNNDAK